MTTTVLVLRGGPDLERDVSLASGAAVAAALRANLDLVVADAIVDAPDEAELADLVARASADVVFPVLHGAWGEGGPLQARLEAVGVPFVGADSVACAAAMDKVESKRRAAEAGVPTPPAAVVEPGAPCPIAPPLVLKPVADGSSVDLRICRDDGAVAAARDDLHPRRGALLAERFVPGRELTVGLLDDAVLPTIEILPAVEFYDYAAKYERDDTRYRIDPDLPEGVAAALARHARAAWNVVGARDLARVDFILEGDRPWFLEINTMPGFTDHSLLPMAARAVGLELPELCRRLVARAAARVESGARR